ncbi:Hypothetical protein GbCGDNIH3_7057 [Granulibacter bethesdensis]|uniref:Uncharacterized protein n=1 Tax=Granulibacter bethesdensis TaxID=364410 RepID=A0AAN0RE47_9PROT|nr:hypothetical protein [Granulibacter bethesdensis]AHJ63251.1 Hypothetical protein GbCGDNIH3_7057 [Granulibacter bethesdensis]
MSETIDILQAETQIERALQETRKFIAEREKLMAEREKLMAEAAKLDRDRKMSPIAILTSLLGVLIGAAVTIITQLVR